MKLIMIISEEKNSLILLIAMDSGIKIKKIKVQKIIQLIIILVTIKHCLILIRL